MKKRSLFLALATAFLVSNFGAMEAKAGPVTLQSLLVAGATYTAPPTGTYNGMEYVFSNFAYTSAANSEVAASMVTVNTQEYASGQPLAGSPASLGLSFTPATGKYWSGNLTDYLTYTVTVIKPTGGSINFAVLASASYAGTGVSILSESAGTAVLGVFASGNGSGASTGTTTGVSVVKTSLSNFDGVGSDHILNLNETFSALAVPEPSSMSLLGIGMASFFALRRFLNKRNDHV
jgi:hypothetical protein